MSSPLPTEELTLNPRATHPPFAWSIGIPSNWAMLDTSPASWKLNAERLIDAKFQGKRLKAPEKRAIFDYLERCVAQSQQADTILCALQFGLLSNQQLGSAAVHLLWYDTGKSRAGLDEVHDMLPTQSNTTPLETGLGPALLVESQSSLIPPGATRRVRMMNYQGFLPVHGTRWMAILSGSAAQSEMERVVREVVTAMTLSLDVEEGHFEPPSGTAGDSGSGGAAGDPAAESTVDPNKGYERVGESAAPGIARGFGTLVQRGSGQSR